MKLLPLVFFLFHFLSFSAFAAEKVIGSACSGDQSAVDWDAIAQCNGSVFVKAPLFFGTATGVTCTAANAGKIQWNGTDFVVCTGSSWTSMTVPCGNTTHGSQLFTSSGTFTPLAGTSAGCPLTIRVVAVGAGGARDTAAYSGGGSGYVNATTLSLTSTASIATTVGVGTVAASGSASAFGGYLTANGGSVAASAGGAGGSGGAYGNSSTQGVGGANGSAGGNGGGSGQGTFVNSTTNVMGVIFQSATFAAGTGGPVSGGSAAAKGKGYGAGDGAQAGGGGGLIINGAYPNDTSMSVGTVGVVYVEW